MRETIKHHWKKLSELKRECNFKVITPGQLTVATSTIETRLRYKPQDKAGNPKKTEMNRDVTDVSERIRYTSIGSRCNLENFKTTPCKIKLYLGCIKLYKTLLHLRLIIYAFHETTRLITS